MCKHRKKLASNTSFLSFPPHISHECAMVAFENGEKLGSLFHNLKINFSIEIQNVYREYFHLEMLKSGRYRADVSLTSRVSGFGLRALTDVFCRYLQVLLSAVVQMVPPFLHGIEMGEELPT